MPTNLSEDELLLKSLKVEEEDDDVFFLIGKSVDHPPLLDLLEIYILSFLSTASSLASLRPVEADTETAAEEEEEEEEDESTAALDAILGIR